MSNNAPPKNIGENDAELVEQVIQDSLFLSMAMFDTRRALESYRIYVEEDSIVAIEKAAERARDVWRALFKEAATARGSNICGVNCDTK